MEQVVVNNSVLDHGPHDICKDSCLKFTFNKHVILSLGGTCEVHQQKELAASTHSCHFTDISFLVFPCSLPIYWLLVQLVDILMNP